MIPEDELSAHVGRLRRIAFVLLRDRDEAEDLVQETLARAIAGARTWDRERELGPWLVGILRNTYRDGLHRTHVRLRAAESLSAAAPGSVAPEAHDRIELDETVRVLETLPHEQQQVLLLVAIEGMSYQDTARMLDVPIGTVMSRLGRGREALRQALGRASRGRLRVVE
ncbi:MAG: RNA polymerase sigma factor [Alphaproteobacteria bacterium]